jgi:hypothetical protein
MIDVHPPHHAATIVLSEQEKHDLLLSMIRVDARLQNLRSTMIYFQAANTLGLRNHKINLEGLLKVRQESTATPR